eukprot:3548245-Pyramimonas_sp.AAC.1
MEGLEVASGQERRTPARQNEKLHYATLPDAHGHPSSAHWCDSSSDAPRRHSYDRALLRYNLEAAPAEGLDHAV